MINKNKPQGKLLSLPLWVPDTPKKDMRNHRAKGFSSPGPQCTQCLDLACLQSCRTSDDAGNALSQR